jgi:hypothetical protein
MFHGGVGAEDIGYDPTAAPPIEQQVMKREHEGIRVCPEPHQCESGEGGTGQREAARPIRLEEGGVLLALLVRREVLPVEVLDRQLNGSMDDLS